MTKNEAHFEIYSKKYPGLRRKWYWRFRAANGEIVAHGEGYYNKEDCYNAVSLVQSTTILTPVEWQSPQ